MKIANTHTVAALSGALALRLVLVVTSAARGTAPQTATSAAWPPHPRDMVFLHFDPVQGQSAGSPPVVDYHVPNDAHFVLTGLTGGGSGSFDLIDASSGTLKVPASLWNAVPGTAASGDESASCSRRGGRSHGCTLIRVVIQT